MTEVGIQRFGSGGAKEDRTQEYESSGVLGKKPTGINRIHRLKNERMTDQLGYPYGSEHEKPDQHYRAEV